MEEIWGELMGQRVEVTGSMINLLLRACADGKGSDGFHTATALLEQGEAEGLFSLGARQSGICSLLNMCTGKMERNETWDADVVGCVVNFIGLPSPPPALPPYHSAHAEFLCLSPHAPSECLAIWLASLRNSALCV